MPFILTSPAFAPGAAVPIRFTCDGADQSPPLAWRDAPHGTVTFALVVDDPDAPSGRFTHWLVWNIAGTRHRLEEGLSTGPIGLEGVNDFGRSGYRGPCPPRGRGPHHYQFQVHALDSRLDLPAGASRGEVDVAIEGHVLGSAILQGRYERS